MSATPERKALEALRTPPSPVQRLGAAISRRDWNEVEQAHAIIRDLLDALPAALSPEASAVEAEPVAYRYRYSDPVSGKPVWRNSSGSWNGQQPSETQPLYASPPASAGVREALEPFLSFADHAVEKAESGWVWKNSSRERICDWFGPSDFGLLQHFAPPSPVQ